MLCLFRSYTGSGGESVKKLLTLWLLCVSASACFCSCAAPAATVSAPEKLVCLTFDDGPHPAMTGAVLDILEREGVPGTFFLIGNRLDRECAPLVKRILDGGSAVGCHTSSHDYARAYADAASLRREIAEWESAFESFVGPLPAVRLFRFPGGSANSAFRRLGSAAAVLRAVPIDLGYTVWDWNVLTDDAAGAGSIEAQKAAFDRSFSAYERSGAGAPCVVLMHDGIANAHTLTALGRIIAFLRQRGYRFVTLADLSASF